MGRKIKNRIGIRYGRLIVLKFINLTWSNHALWKCQCDCGKEIIVQGSNLQSRMTRSCGCLRKETASKLRKNQTGINNPNYIDGISCGKATKEILELKERIRKRDNYICQKCDKIQKQELKEHNRKLDVHHIDGDNTNNEEENMITFCRSCHEKEKMK